MKSKNLEKNILDLDYRKQLQILNAVIILGTTGVLSFIGTFVWRKELLGVGLVIAFFIIGMCLVVYAKVNQNLHEITESIRNLKEV